MDKNGKSHGQSPVIMMSPDGAFMHLTNPTTVKQSSLSLLNCSRDKERSHRPVKPVHPPTVCSYGSSGAAVSGACQPFFSNIQIEKQLSGQHCIYVTPDTISIQSNQKPFKLKKRRRNSDSSSSDSDDETANLLKSSNIIAGPKRTTRNQDKIQEQIEREERTIHTCYYDDIHGDYALNRGPEDKCPICKYKKRLRKVRVSLDISNAIDDNQLGVTQSGLWKTMNIPKKTKNFHLKVPSTSNYKLAALRRLPRPVATESEREKSPRKGKATLFQSQGEILDLNKRTHPHVSDIEFYKRSTETICENNACIKEIRQRKSLYRDQMLIEKSIGMYDAEYLSGNLDTVNCNYCGDKLVNKNDENGAFQCDTFCTFCFNSLKELHFTAHCVDLRKDERRKNVDVRLRYISAENRKRKKERGAKKDRSSSRCPHLIFKTPFTDEDNDEDDNDIDDDENEAIAISKFESMEALNGQDENGKDDEYTPFSDKQPATTLQLL